MRSSIASALIWGYWANMVYLIGMVGYLTIDIISYTYTSLNSTVSSVIYIILTVIFVIDAILYTIDWYMYAVKVRQSQDEPIQYRSEFVACIFENLGSCFYLIGAVLGFDKIHYIEKIFLFNFIGTNAFIIEATFTFLGWFITFRRKALSNPKNGCTIQVKTNTKIKKKSISLFLECLYMGSYNEYDWKFTLFMCNNLSHLFL
jgi:hypothetical protein